MSSRQLYAPAPLSSNQLFYRPTFVERLEQAVRHDSPRGFSHTQIGDNSRDDTSLTTPDCRYPCCDAFPTKAFQTNTAARATRVTRARDTARAERKVRKINVYWDDFGDLDEAPKHLQELLEHRTLLVEVNESLEEFEKAMQRRRQKRTSAMIERLLQGLALGSQSQGTVTNPNGVVPAQQ